MPNWCSNHIAVRGTNQAEIKRLADAFDAGELCQAVIPCPEDLQITAGSLGHNTPEQLDLEAKERSNLEKYGVKNWYDFQTSRWGTKWDISIADVCERDDDGLGFSGCFDTAWSPPIGVAEALIEQGFEVTLYYYEPGMAFCGKFEDGYDDSYSLEGENSQSVRANIGDELDDMFGISESMAEYEAENEEEEELTEWIKDGADKRAELKTL